VQTKFEHFAASSMLCAKDAPPRQNGNFYFDREWEARAFGVALSLSKSGYFEWEDFRENLLRMLVVSTRTRNIAIRIDRQQRASQKPSNSLFLTIIYPQTHRSIQNAF
jgi:hypothetical protein